MPADIEQTAGTQNRRILRQRGFAGAFRGQDESATRIARGQHHGQRTANRPQLPRERKLAGKFVIAQLGIGNLPRGGENAERDRQIEPPRFLGQIGGRQIDGDAPGRKFKTGILQGGAYAVARLPDLDIGQTDQRDARQTTGQMHFGGDSRRIETVEAATMNDGEGHEETGETEGQSSAGVQSKQSGREWGIFRRRRRHEI